MASPKFARSTLVPILGSVAAMLFALNIYAYFTKYWNDEAQVEETKSEMHVLYITRDGAVQELSPAMREMKERIRFRHEDRDGHRKKYIIRFGNRIPHRHPHSQDFEHFEFDLSDLERDLQRLERDLNGDLKMELELNRNLPREIHVRVPQLQMQNGAEIRVGVPRVHILR